MKYFSLVLFSVLIFSCTKTEQDCSDTLICEGECLFLEINNLGTMMEANCFNTWGVVCKSNDTGEDILILLPELDTHFQKENMNVTFSASVFQNDIPLQFPDPSIGFQIFKGELCEIVDQ